MGFHANRSRASDATGLTPALTAHGWAGAGKGFNFRDTIPFVRDADNETCVRRLDVYPLTRSIDGDSVTFGWASAPGTAINALATIDRRLAGYAEYSSARTFWLELPAPGVYDVRIALGAPANKALGGGQQPEQTLSIVDGDGSTLLYSYGPHTANEGLLYDAAENLWPTANWASLNIAKRLTFSSPTGIPGNPINITFSAGSPNSWYAAHIFVQQVSAVSTQIPYQPNYLWAPMLAQ